MTTTPLSIINESKQLYLSSVGNELNTTVQKEPDELFVKGNDFMSVLDKHTCFEFGNKPLHKTDIITFSQQPQPIFNKNFEMLFSNLLKVYLL
jgi:hypothetical protein